MAVPSVVTTARAHDRYFLTSALLRKRILACRAVSRQRLGKQFPHATIEVLLETVFSIWSAQRGYKRENWSKNSSAGRELPFREDLSPEEEE
jgi:hypothetical protein